MSNTQTLRPLAKRGPVPLGDQVSSGKDPTPSGGQKGKKKEQPASTVETPELISADPEIDADNLEMNTGPTDPTAKNSESAQEGVPKQSSKAAGKQPEVVQESTVGEVESAQSTVRQPSESMENQLRRTLEQGLENELRRSQVEALAPAEVLANAIDNFLQDVGDQWRSRDRGDALVSSHGVNPYRQNTDAIERMCTAVHEVTCQEAEDPREAARRLARQRRAVENNAPYLSGRDSDIMCHIQNIERRMLPRELDVHGARRDGANMAKDVEEAVRPLQTIPEMTPTSTIATDYRWRMTVTTATTGEAAQAATTDERVTPGLK
ncbi:hypothetical protein BV22DRAFT_1134539 [Leucogyrophana mollusca]|uniref:Uncharacterized protein n=1 Tax=Leucogyrophana mollusca TaxID=85980 RepID=A0ACB8AYW9_9AGAM|nr:hypothetical protein BV22DRAFT_1134539 [Leucogyrophana mollusca]